MSDGTYTSWAGQATVGFDALERVHRGLTVELIMTPRCRLMTCRREDSVRDVMSRNTGMYSYLPVVDEAGVILGLYRAEKWWGEEAPDQPICADFEPLSEALVMGADATIIEFLKTVDERRPTKLVVSGYRVAGLVGLSDFHKLPVRAALFTLITSVEIAMATCIAAVTWPDGGASWLALLSEKRRKETRDKIGQSKQNDSFINEILHTQLADKCTIIRKSKLIQGSQRKLTREFSAICKLRDEIAHANYYAETPTKALKVCSVVKTILQMQQLLSSAAAQSVYE